MNASGGTCGSPSSAEPAGDFFKELWSKLKECHDKEVQGKTAFCESGFYLVPPGRFEPEYRSMCVELNAFLMSCVMRDDGLVNEKNSLQDENKKISEQFQQLEQKQQALDVEEGVIPDSPVLTSSFSMVNRMRRKKENRHIRYTEQHPDLELAKSNSGKRWYCLAGLGFFSFFPHSPENDLISHCIQSFSTRNNSSTSHASCILDSDSKPNVKINLFNNPSSSRSHKNRSKSEDVAFVAPLNLGTEINSVISQVSINRQMVVKKNSNEVVTSVGNTCAAKNEVIKSDFLLVHQKQPEGRCAKRKKAEDEHAISCENASFNKENSVPFRSDIQHVNGEHTGDKPLDLSDRFCGVRCQEKKQGSEETCKNKLKQVTLYDVFLQLGKPIHEGSSSVQNANERSLFGRDMQEEPYVQEAVLAKTFADTKKQTQMKEEVPPLKITPLPSTVDTEQLFNDVKVASDHVPNRKKTRTGHGESEPASVLQPNPCRLSKNKVQPNEQEKPLENLQWSIDPGADLAQYKMDVTVIDTKDDSQSRIGGEVVDMDYTYVSESVLLKMKNQEQTQESSPRREKKMNDTITEMFDRTADEEYESCLPEDSLSACDEKETVRGEEQDKGITVASKKLKSEIYIDI
uniref:RB binding protein 8, endonuclease n=1 Tax=Pavo cristatus TaxID=9049 RepID=A0A8C9EHA0_PAVCR